METKEVYVKAHVRLIKQRSYRFVCKECNRVVERICYPSRPLYCERCRPSKTTSNKPPIKVVKSTKNLSKKNSPARQKNPKVVK